MKRIFRTTITATFVVVLLGMGFVSKAAAQCGPFGSSNVEISSHSCWADSLNSLMLRSHMRTRASTSWDSGRRSLFLREAPA